MSASFRTVCVGVCVGVCLCVGVCVSEGGIINQLQ